MPFESLTPDLTMSYIGWVQAGGAWALCVPSFHMCPKSVCWSFVCRGLEACLHSLPSVFFDLLCELLFDFPLPWGVGLYLILGFTFLSAHFLITLISCHITLSLLLQWLNPAGSLWASRLLFHPVAWYDHWFSYLWAPMSLWASLAHLLSLGFLDPFINSTFLWVFTNFIEFPWPNYLILILGVHGPVINPLLSLFASLLACGSPFSLFYIIYCPWVCYFSLSGLL